MSYGNIHKVDECLRVLDEVKPSTYDDLGELMRAVCVIRNKCDRILNAIEDAMGEVEQ